MTKLHLNPVPSSVNKKMAGLKGNESETEMVGGQTE